MHVTSFKLVSSLKATAAVVVAAFLVTLAADRAGAKAKAEFTVSISIASPDLSAGANDKLEIVLKNVSDHDIYVAREVGECQAELEYTVIVRDEAHRVVEQTRYGEEAKKKMIDMGEVSGNLPPGQELRGCSVLEKLIPFKVGATYTVQVERDLKSSPLTGTVRSNILKIRVVR